MFSKFLVVGYVLKFILKFIIVFAICISSYSASARVGNSCSSLFFEMGSEVSESKSYNFKDGHNVGLRNIMLKIKEYELFIQEFVQELSEGPTSKYLQDRSSQYRNFAALEKVLDVARKYEKALSHMVEHSDHLLMTPRIQMIPLEKREAFVKAYKQAYIDYLATFQLLIAELETFKTQDPSAWDNRVASDIIMRLHTQMGVAHNKF